MARRIPGEHFLRISLYQAKLVKTRRQGGFVQAPAQIEAADLSLRALLRSAPAKILLFNIKFNCSF